TATLHLSPPIPVPASPTRTHAATPVPTTPVLARGGGVAVEVGAKPEPGQPATEEERRPQDAPRLKEEAGAQKKPPEAQRTGKATGVPWYLRRRLAPRPGQVPGAGGQNAAERRSKSLVLGGVVTAGLLLGYWSLIRSEPYNEAREAVQL